MRSGQALVKCYVLVLLAALFGCVAPPSVLTVKLLDSPAPSGSLVPQVTRLSNGDVAMSWQEQASGGGYKFAMALRKDGKWSSAKAIASGPNVSMFHADLPGIAELPGGALLAYWELKDSRDGDRTATTIQTSVSKDNGGSWRGAAPLYPDSLAGQHSFLAPFRLADGLGLVWLDAQQRSLMRHAAKGAAHTGAVGLRYARLNPDGDMTYESFIQPITCECCPTSAVVTGKGPVVVYRGRQEAPGTKPADVLGNRPTVRDIYITRLEGGEWQKPRLVHADNWIINACPDNGPAVDAFGSDVAVAWWTASGDAPKVFVAFSSDAGDTFGEPVRVDAARGEGQVTLALLKDGKSAVAGWLEGGQVWARLVSAKGVEGPAVALGRSPRHSRLPRWLEEDGNVLAGWTSSTEGRPRVELSLLTVYRRH